MNAQRHHQTRGATIAAAAATAASATAVTVAAHGHHSLRPRPTTRTTSTTTYSNTAPIATTTMTNATDYQMMDQPQYGMKLRKTASRMKIATKMCPDIKMKKQKKRPISCRSNKRCFCLPQSYSPVAFPTVWNELRKTGQLCDGIVRCEDAVEFEIHRAILSAASPYFRALFTTTIHGNCEHREASIQASSNVFKEIVDYAYSGTCAVTVDNVERLLAIADQYEFLGVVQLCCQFILNQLEPTNCLGILKFAKHYFCRELENRGQKFILQNFTELLRVGEEFEHLDIDEVMNILQQDELNVRNEEIVFAAIRKWVDYNAPVRAIFLPDLMKCVRIGTLSSDFINKMLLWPPLRDNEECLGGIYPVFNMFERQSITLDLVSNTMLRPRIPYDILFAVGGWSAGSPTNFVETYDTRADRWLLSRDADAIPRAYHGLCALRGLIYMIGGFDGNEHFNTVRCFDPIIHEWRECACMYYPRCYVSVVMHDQKIYAMGGYNGRVRMNSAERYDPDTNQWELISPMQKQRSDASAAVLNDKIYIVGGFNGQEVMSSAEMYDVLTNQWSYIPSMISARSGVSLLAFKNTLYALGGFNGYTRLTTGEKYQPSLNGGATYTNEQNGSQSHGFSQDHTNWVAIAEMFSSRSNFATVILDNLIFAIGGFNDRFVAGSTTINYVECYDADVDEWFDSAPMNLNRSALSACVISGLPNARDYSFVGRTVQELGHVAAEGNSNSFVGRTEVTPTQLEPPGLNAEEQLPQPMVGDDLDTL